jgi:hypothetical protein
MLLVDALQVPGEVRLHGGSQHRHAVLVALAAPHDDVVGPEIHVLDAEAATLEEPEAGPVEKKRHQSRRAFEPAQHRPHLVPGQDDGQALRALGPDDLVHPREVDFQDHSVQEQQGAQRLVLGGGGALPVDGEGAQETGDLGRSHVGGVTLVVEEDVAADPGDVGRLGSAAVMSGADGGADAVEQSWLGCAARVGFSDAKCESEGG